ncbi:expressed unknown protein [Seminavis robusta]|uniref:Uncharacterized protein n=1 Tax=Seminavis robusta TaxID=568900 RepID=A0A9N8HR44_9STRA|nr:expressed unknown protein [Seminavis robusta]|eukprot:Sro1226_g254140.1 n/a (272) ;mRNA; f:3759-4574
MNAQKKRKATDNKEEGNAIPSKKKSTAASKKENGGKEKERFDGFGFKPLTLKEIHDRIAALAKQVPPIPDEGFYVEGTSPHETSSVIGEPPNNLKKALIKRWASELQVVLEELGLVLCCVSTACYKWGTDRSGASDQNLSLLNDELNSTQDQIASRVTPRLRNVLTPVVDLVVEKTVTTKIKQPKEGRNNGDASITQDGVTEDGFVEVKRNVFTRQLEDPDFVHLCYQILARNAPMMRNVVLTNFTKMLQCIKDYLGAQNNDTQHHREFAY